MKKLAILLLTAASVLMTGCSNGTKVSREKFYETVNQLEDHQYKKVKIVETEKRSAKGEYASDPYNNFVHKVIYNLIYNEPIGYWEPEEGSSIFTKQIKSIKYAEAVYEGANTTYYIKPLRIVMNNKADIYTSKAEYKYDKYGFTTYDYSKNTKKDEKGTLTIEHTYTYIYK